MALPKGKLMALLAVFAAIGIVTATGAFTQVTADRTATVEAVGDASANLGLVPYAGPNGYAPTAAGNAATDNSYGYAQISDGTLTIDLRGFEDGSAETSSGLNYNARTTFDNVFNITNNGEQNIDVHIDATSGNHQSTVAFYKGTVSGGTNMTTSANSVTLTPGETIQVSIEVDLTGLTAGGVTNPLVDQIQITANAQ